MLWLSYETNSLLPDLTHMLAGGHAGSTHGAKHEMGGGRKVKEGKSPHNNLIASWESFPRRRGSKKNRKEWIQTTWAQQQHLINSLEIYGVTHQ